MSEKHIQNNQDQELNSTQSHLGHLVLHTGEPVEGQQVDTTSVAESKPSDDDNTLRFLIAPTGRVDEITREQHDELLRHTSSGQTGAHS